MQTDYNTLFILSQLSSGLAYTSYKAFNIYKDIKFQFNYPNYKKKISSKINHLLPLNLGYRTIITDKGEYRVT